MPFCARYTSLEALGAELTVIPAVSPTGGLAYDDMEGLLTPKTKWLVCNHASNVTGNVLDLNRIKAFCRNTAGAHCRRISNGRCL